MKKKLLLLSVVIIALGSASCEKSHEDHAGADTVIEILDESFTRIHGSSNFEIELIKSDNHAVRLEIPGEYGDCARVKVENETLTLYFENKHNDNDRDYNIKVKVYVSVSSLEEISLDNMCSIKKIEGAFVHNGKFKLSLSYMSGLFGLNLTCEELDLIVDDMSHVGNSTFICDNADMNVTKMSSIEGNIDIANLLNLTINDMAKGKLVGTALKSTISVNDMSSFDGTELVTGQ